MNGYTSLRSSELQEASSKGMASPTPQTPTSPGSTAESASRQQSSGCITHKVDSKRDTLAGLAIKYNVSVADIKRANGLLSDNALFARDTIQIPTMGLPLGHELQLMIAQVATGFGRDPVLNAEANLHPASAAAARAARTLNLVNGHSYPPDDGSGLPWWCHCGGCDVDDSQASCRSHQHGGGDSDSDPGEYEMQERGAGSSLADGPTRMHGRMRRRKAHLLDGEDGESDGAEGSAPQQQQWQRRLPSRPPGPSLFAGGGGGGQGQQGEGVNAVLKQLSDFGKTLGEISIIQKIKAAASQPALAVPQNSRHSLAEAADAVLGSLARKGNVGLPHGSSGSAGMAAGGPLSLPRSHNASTDGSSPVLQRSRVSKAGGKDD